jgi:hypothetical protein
MNASRLNNAHYVMHERANLLARLGQNLLMSWCNSSETGNGDAYRKGRGGVDGGKVLHVHLPFNLGGVE